MAQRPRRAPASVLGVTDVLTTIIQCTPKPKDVLSFLQALPPNVRTPAMAALLQLLVPSVEAKNGYSYYWPLAWLGKSNDDDVELVVAAVPLFNNIVLDGFSTSQRWPASDDPNYSFGFCAFLAKWAKKVVQLNLFKISAKKYRPDFCRLLRQCTNIKSAFMPYEPDLLEALMTPAHNVPDLDFIPPTLKTHPLEAAALIQRWLASGPERRAKFHMLQADAGLACALASSPHLTSLDVSHSECILSSLILNSARLTHLTELVLACVHGTDAPGDILPLLNPHVLTKLSIEIVARTEVVGLASALAELVALEQLVLRCIDLRTLPRINGAAVSAMRTLEFWKVQLTSTSVANVLDWVTRSPRLESVILRYARATALANGLRNTHARHRTIIDLSRNKVLIAAARAMLSALATCTNVSIKLTNSLRTLSVDDQAKQAGVTIEWYQRDVWPSCGLTLHSTGT
ncbi:hypothetical protein SPRG_11136 [Saprolegnia parasitica CBS 223.65]|uniref:Uncharacterized protein n=1 Tax=Saprolegnia parasitica (strain CBS 223.65) TaxID=695850 RepID=A0A067BZL6_SAPPC|nr:hypothetical protein SPRG_11136 [Saprolegnia parasitica CBS 223.65]KDO23688.1 hypothetical protein SPRG_11136 [Saprolegnia parasitica CBS 223.65]|eukprot:XP_012205671.1 hypothetical protein SPRG_11136 [Saprolegnia parasitica CBS 223.65]